MVTQSLEIIRPYLALLTNPHIEVRRQACYILIGTHGEYALTHLRRLLDHPDPQVGRQARAALEAIAMFTDVNVEVQPFQDMYIECMGELRVYIGNRLVQPHDWAQADGGRAGRQKVQSVLAYLAHCGRRGASRAALTEAIWGGNATSLSRTLTALRQMLTQIGGVAFADQALMTTREHCALNTQCYQTDAQRFERLFDLAMQTEETRGLEDAMPLYTQAMSLYSGHYMANIPRGSGWSIPKRELLTSNFLIAAERLAEESYMRHQYGRCIMLCQQALDIDQTADDMTVWLLRAYARLGHIADLEYVYQRYLRAADLKSPGAESRHDVVIQAYQSLMQARAVNETGSFEAV